MMGSELTRQLSWNDQRAHLDPSVTALALLGGAYAEKTIAAGEEPLVVTEPFPVTFRPSDLLFTP